MAKNQGRSGPKDPITGLNSRQEAFCRFIVAGYGNGEAYEAAGYNIGVNGGQPMHSRAKGEGGLRPTAQNLAAKLMRLPHIKARILALSKEQQVNVDRMRSLAIERWAIDVEKTTKMLLEDRHFARTGELSLRDENGMKTDTDEAPPDWRPDPRAAVQATMGLAKLHGLLIDRKEVTVIDAMQNMNNDELINFIGKLQSQLGPVIDVECSPVGTMSRRITSEVIDADDDDE
jgi:hypothetical protein